jgi:hypothetical protein
MDDLELITEFRSHVEEPDIDRVARARGALTNEFAAAAPPPRPARVARWRPALAAVAVPVAVAVAVLVAVNAFGGSGTSVADAAILFHADAALTAAPNEILYTDVAGGGFGAQTWQLTSPPYSFLGFKGPLGQRAPEQAQDAAGSSWWDPTTNTIHEQRGGAAPVFDDPLAAVHEALDRRDARVLGSATTDGIPTYAIQFSGKHGYNDGLTAFVDKRTYRPILLIDPQRDGSIVRLKVVAFEFLPANEANLRLLSLTARHPSARIVVDTTSPKLAPKN